MPKRQGHVVHMAGCRSVEQHGEQDSRVEGLPESPSPQCTLLKLHHKQPGQKRLGCKMQWSPGHKAASSGKAKLHTYLNLCMGLLQDSSLTMCRDLGREWVASGPVLVNSPCKAMAWAACQREGS